jgi:hypothetical protein
VEASEIASASRHLVHDLMADSEAVRRLGDDVRRSIGKGWQMLDSSLAAVADTLTTNSEGTYLRPADYLDQGERLPEERPDVIAAKHVAADFVFIDRGLAQLAEIAGLDVQDVDPVNPS